MTREEAEHFVKAYIECDLYERIKAIKEGNFANEKEMVKEAIENCKKTLSKWCEYIPDMNTFIKQSLEDIEKEHQKVIKIRNSKNSTKESNYRNSEEQER